jgi:hypothetical protein
MKTMTCRFSKVHSAVGTALQTSVVDPDQAGSKIICTLGSGSVINFESGTKLSFVSNLKIKSIKNVQIKKKLALL